MAWSWSQHPVYDNAFSLETTSTYTISRRYGVYYSTETFNFIKDRYKYLEFNVMGYTLPSTNAMAIFSYYPLVPKGVVISSFQIVNDYFDNAKGASDLVLWCKNGNISTNDPSIEVTPKYGVYNRLRPSNISGTPVRIGIAMSKDSFLMHHIYSSTNIATQIFSNYYWTSSTTKRKIGFAWPNVEGTDNTNHKSQTVYLDKSTWLSDYAKNNYDDIKTIYPVEEELFKQY